MVSDDVRGECSVLGTRNGGTRHTRAHVHLPVGSPNYKIAAPSGWEGCSRHENLLLARAWTSIATCLLHVMA
jgi:hypothetical protein